MCLWENLSRIPMGPTFGGVFSARSGHRTISFCTFRHQPVADVDGDGKKEIVAIVGKDRWDLKVYDGMTGAEKLSLPNVEPSADVFDFDGDGISEIAVYEKNALVIGNVASTDNGWKECGWREAGCV